MDQIIVPVFAQGEGEPQNVLYQRLQQMIGMVEAGLWGRDNTHSTEHGKTTHCTYGLVEETWPGN